MQVYLIYIVFYLKKAYSFTDKANMKPVTVTHLNIAITKATFAVAE